MSSLISISVSDLTLLVICQIHTHTERTIFNICIYYTCRQIVDEIGRLPHMVRWSKRAPLITRALWVDDFMKSGSSVEA